MRTLGAWLHDLDPFVVRFTDTFGVRWYGLAYVAGFAAAWWILKTLSRRAMIRVKEDRVADLIVAVIVGTLVGGRLGYVLIYNQALLWDFRATVPWWGLLAINEGGMASHGGMIGIVLACWWFARRSGLPPLHVMDCLALASPVGVFLGRVANFVNGELLGRIVAMPGERAPWWAVKFPQELMEGHAPPLTESQREELVRLIEDVAGPGASAEEGFRQVLHAVRHGDANVASRLEPLISARHPSQLYQAIAEGIVVGAAVWLVFLWRRPAAGVVTAWFLIVYGVGRMLTEVVRLPDAHLAVPRIAGLSRGQWLSAAMAAVGAWLLWRAAGGGRSRGGAARGSGVI